MIILDIKVDESISEDYQYVDENDVAQTIEADYNAYAVLENGFRQQIGNPIALTKNGTVYELRIGASTVSGNFEVGEVFYLQVYEENIVLDYRDYLHEAKYRVKA